MSPRATIKLDAPLDVPRARALPDGRVLSKPSPVLQFEPNAQPDAEEVRSSEIQLVAAGARESDDAEKRTTTVAPPPFPVIQRIVRRTMVDGDEAGASSRVRGTKRVALLLGVGAIAALVGGLAGVGMRAVTPPVANVDRLAVTSGMPQNAHAPGRSLVVGGMPHDSVASGRRLPSGGLPQIAATSAAAGEDRGMPQNLASASDAPPTSGMPQNVDPAAAVATDHPTTASADTGAAAVNPPPAATHPAALKPAAPIHTVRPQHHTPTYAPKKNTHRAQNHRFVPSGRAS